MVVRCRRATPACSASTATPSTQHRGRRRGRGRRPGRRVPARPVDAGDRLPAGRSLDERRLRRCRRAGRAAAAPARCTPGRASPATSTCSGGRRRTSPPCRSAATACRRLPRPRRRVGRRTPCARRRAAADRAVQQRPARRELHRRRRRCWLIDYEYSGNNDTCFELGNTATECDFTPEQVEAYTEAYFGTPTRADLARVRLQMLCSEYGWSLWGFIQAAASPIDFDFHGLGHGALREGRRDLPRRRTSTGAAGGGGTVADLPTARAGRDRRRRGDRHLGRLPPDQARLDRRAAARAGHALRRYDVARGRPGRAAARLGERHPAGAVLRRALRRRSRPRPGWRPATATSAG